MPKHLINWPADQVRRVAIKYNISEAEVRQDVLRYLSALEYPEAKGAKEVIDVFEAVYNI